MNEDTFTLIETYALETYRNGTTTIVKVSDDLAAAWESCKQYSLRKKPHMRNPLSHWDAQQLRPPANWHNYNAIRQRSRTEYRHPLQLTKRNAAATVSPVRPLDPSLRKE